MSSDQTTDDDRMREETAADLRGAPHVDAEVLRRGTALGRYVVLERLGAGGMGVVYAALDPELGRRVAIKIVRSRNQAIAGDTEHVSSGAARLIREAQAMARLHHPNVIAVHDVGTVAGRVFIAMEYLDGGTLGEWIGREHPSWSAILQRFAAAGAGLAAAHAAGIVHRDFKADNVMLGNDARGAGGIGRVCVVDFGLARAGNELGDTWREESTRRASDSFDSKLTRTGALMGTPAYMAPEQHAGTIADARSDQFSFCVALYEALYGQRPFAGDSSAGLAANVLDGALRPVPETSAVPKWLYPIIARGLAVQPQSRWADMDALLAALADDPTVRRRRRWTRAAMATLVIGGVTLPIAYVQQRAGVCTHARPNFDAVWSADARAEASEAFASSGRAHAAQAWTQTEQELDRLAERWSDAHTEACRATSVRGEQSEDMLDRRMSCLAQRLREVEVVVELLRTADAGVVDRVTKVVGQIGDVQTCSDTTALLSALPQPALADRPEADEIHTLIARTQVLRTAGRNAEASETIEGLDARIEALGYAPLTAEYFYTLAATELDRGRPADAVAHLYTAGLHAAQAGDAPLEAQVWIALVRAVAIHEDRPLELPPLVKSAEIAVARAGNTALHRGLLAATLGTRALQHDEYSLAEDQLREAVGLLGEALGPDHVDTLDAREMLALTFHARRRYDEAEAGLAEVAEAIERTQGPTHPSLGTVLGNLSRIHAARGEFELARSTGERALESLVAGFGPDHQVVASAHGNLAITSRKLGRYDEAARHLEAALTIETKLFGPESPRIATDIHGRGELELARGRPQAALADYREALRIWTTTLGRDELRNAYALTGIGAAEVQLGHADAAITALERALALREPAKDVGADDLAETRFVLAQALRLASRDRERAVALAQQARDAYAKLDAHDEVRDIDAWLAATH